LTNLYYISNNTIYTVILTTDIVFDTMYLIFDTETTGLPIFNKTGLYRFPSYRHLNKYNTSRIVSISWIVANEKCEKLKQAYHIIRPLDFTIDNNSKAVEIHGITAEMANEQGISWHTMYDEFINDLVQCDTIVAHNIQFDISIMLSEMHRYNKDFGISTLLNKQRLCTMKMGKIAMKQTRVPKLSVLYEFLYNEPIQNAHDASYDTLHCYKCLVRMLEQKELDVPINVALTT
jgi:DNA polymerase-3 subunit alpha